MSRGDQVPLSLIFHILWPAIRNEINTLSSDKFCIEYHWRIAAAATVNNLIFSEKKPSPAGPEYSNSKWGGLDWEGSRVEWSCRGVLIGVCQANKIRITTERSDRHGGCDRKWYHRELEWNILITNHQMDPSVVVAYVNRTQAVIVVRRCYLHKYFLIGLSSSQSNQLYLLYLEEEGSTTHQTRGIGCSNWKRSKLMTPSMGFPTRLLVLLLSVVGGLVNETPIWRSY